MRKEGLNYITNDPAESRKQNQTSEDPPRDPSEDPSDEGGFLQEILARILTALDNEILSFCYARVRYQRRRPGRNCQARQKLQNYIRRKATFNRNRL
jgi:hypothetical protein